MVGRPQTQTGSLGSWTLRPDLMRVECLAGDEVDWEGPEDRGGPTSDPSQERGEEVESGGRG